MTTVAYLLTILVVWLGGIAAILEWRWKPRGRK
jgi:hypothetical protein